MRSNLLVSVANTCKWILRQYRGAAGTCFSSTRWSPYQKMRSNTGKTSMQLVTSMFDSSRDTYVLNTRPRDLITRVPTGNTVSSAAPIRVYRVVKPVNTPMRIAARLRSPASAEREVSHKSSRLMLDSVVFLNPPSLNILAALWMAKLDSSRRYPAS